MSINISKKIELIRNQPEHIRMLYVWGCVAFFMIVFFLVWIFSINSMIAEHRNLNNEIIPSINEQMRALSEQNLSIEKLSPESSVNSNTSNEKTLPDTNTSDNNSIDSLDITSGVESNRYIDLPANNQ